MICLRRNQLRERRNDYIVLKWEYSEKVGSVGVRHWLQALDLNNKELLFIAELFICRTKNYKKSRMQVKRRRFIPSLSLWKLFKKLRSLSLFLLRILSICGGFFGFATNTCPYKSSQRPEIKHEYSRHAESMWKWVVNWPWTHGRPRTGCSCSCLEVSSSSSSSWPRSQCIVSWRWSWPDRGESRLGVSVIAASSHNYRREWALCTTKRTRWRSCPRSMLNSWVKKRHSYPVVVLIKVFGHHWFMPCECLL